MCWVEGVGCRLSGLRGLRVTSGESSTSSGASGTGREQCAMEDEPIMDTESCGGQGYLVAGLGCGVRGARFRVLDLGCGVWGYGWRV